MERLFCLELLLGKEKVAKLKKAFVVVIGIGAVGSYATEALARTGVRHLRLVDFDTIKSTNFNRHLLAITPNLGKLKAELAGYTPDATTPRGREEIGAKAKKVGVAKQDLLRIAKLRSQLRLPCNVGSHTL